MTNDEGWEKRYRPQQCLNFLPLPQGHGSLRPTFGCADFMGAGPSRRRIGSQQVPKVSPLPQGQGDSEGGGFGIGSLIKEMLQPTPVRIWSAATRRRFRVQSDRRTAEERKSRKK